MISRKILLLLSLLAYIFYAVLATEIGPVLPEISSEFNLRQGTTGAIASLQSLAGLLAVLGGFLSDIFGRSRFISFSIGIIGIGALSLSSSPTVLMIGLSFFLMGTGFAFFEASVNAFISNIFSEKRGMAVNILHIGWSIGSTLGPVIAAIAILYHGSWRLGYLLIAPIMVGFLLFYGVFIPRNVETMNDGGKLERHNTSRIRLLTSILPVFLVSFLLMSCKLGMNTWLPYILREEGGTLIEASLTVSLFWMLIGVGRLVWAPFVDRFGYWKIIMFNSLGSLLLLTLASLSIPLYIKMALYSGTGFLLGPIYPTLIAIATSRSPEMSGALAGALYAFGTLGTVFSTITIGITIEIVGSSIAQIVFPSTVGLITLLSYLSHKQIKQM